MSTALEFEPVIGITKKVKEWQSKCGRYFIYRGTYLGEPDFTSCTRNPYKRLGFGVCGLKEAKKVCQEHSDKETKP